VAIMKLADREIVGRRTDLRVQVLTLAAGQCVPWHYYREITDALGGLDPRAAERISAN
jgi:hypothetical protein